VNDDLAALIAELASVGVCVKVGNWCSRLLSQGQPGRQLSLLPTPTLYHATITPLATPTKWGFTHQGWGNDPISALRQAMARWQAINPAGYLAAVGVAAGGR
jgi:hypothetical protein